ncbi:MAG: hypothetical protein BalsKO_19720 [Balneolaceae bacterium]
MDGIVSLAIATLLLLTIVKFYLPKSEVEHTEGLKIVSINLLSSNQEYEKVISFIKEEDFDIVFFQELNMSWEAKLDELREEYPNQNMIPRSDNFGIGVLSKLEFINVEDLDLSTVQISSILMKVNYKGKELSVLSTHPLPPVGNYYFESRNKQFKSISKFVDAYSSELIVIGDLNSTKFSPNFDLLYKSGKLRDSREGFGLQPTWNAQWSLISITLDDVLVTNGIQILDRGIGPNIGSDHLPVTIEVSWKE